MAAGTQPPTQTQLMTAEELWRMPEDGKRYQLVRGELRAMSPPSIRHARLCMRFSRPLDEFVEKRSLGRVYVGDPGFMLARKPDIVLAPDVALIRADRLPTGPEPAGYWEGAPDLAVEVVSPNDTVYQVEEKVEDWLSLACAMVVVVSDKRRTVTVYRPGRSPRILRGDESFDGEDIIPGFRLPLTEIFA